MDELQGALKQIEWSTFSPILINLFAAIAVLIVGWIIAGWAERTVRRRLGNSKGLEVDDTIRPLLAIVTRYAVVLATMYAALKVSGFPAAPLLAVFGAAGLAIALAAQGTLANVAAGLMLIFLRSIRVGEYIQASNVEGTVLEIGLFTTEIKTSDGIFITVPNAQIWASQIKNYSRYKTRRIDIDIEISRDNDLAEALKVLQKTLKNHDAVIAPDSAETVIAGFTPTSVKLQARCWLKAANLRGSTSSVRLALHEALQAEGFKLPPIPFG
ncbi:MAG: mechanosensitive ion channel family protein [Robiginitomaculum sp.]|nr:mechanosensitive ion channel family protein [Robiginitomaculum sp.]